MGFDKSGQGDHAFATDRGSGRRVERLSDGNDAAILYVDVAAGNVAECRVHRHHIGAADDEFSARRQRSDRTALLGLHRGWAREQREAAGDNARRYDGGCMAEQTSARQRVHEVLPSDSA